MGDVVSGPWGTRPVDPTSPDDSEATDIIQLQLAYLMDVVFAQLDHLGIDVDNIIEDGYIKDMLLVSESIRSFLLKTQGRYHPCQDVADNLYCWDGEKYQTQTSLIVEFK